MSKQIPEHLQHTTIFLLARAAKEGQRAAQKIYHDDELRLMHFAVASVIQQQPEVSQKQLSNIMAMDPSDLGVLVGDLVELGYIERDVNSIDRRRYDLTITPSGSLWLSKCSALAVEFNEQFFGPLTPKQKEQLNKLLLKLI